MPLRLRKRVKVMPGVHLNIGKKGISSISVGKRGGTLNLGKKGLRGTVGIPGTGISYSTQLTRKQRKKVAKQIKKGNYAEMTSTEKQPPSTRAIILITALSLIFAGVLLSGVVAAIFYIIGGLFVLVFIGSFTSAGRAAMANLENETPNSETDGNKEVS